ERLALGIAHRTGFGARLLLGAHALAEQAEGIAPAVETIEVGPRMALSGAHLPGRPVTGQRILLIGHDRGIVHAGEEIIVLIVLAHVIETVAPIILLAPAALGRAMRRFLLAADPFA